MLLQPLIENSIKHGLSPKIGEGRITIRSSRKNGHAMIGEWVQIRIDYINDSGRNEEDR